MRRERQTMDILRMHVANVACLAFFGSRHRPYQWSAETASTTSWTLYVVLRCEFLWMPTKSKAVTRRWKRPEGGPEEVGGSR